MSLWRYLSGAWAPYSADDLTCAGQYASFSTTEPGTFALAAPVPEPASLVLLGMGAAGFLGYGWRCRRGGAGTKYGVRSGKKLTTDH